MIFFLALLIVSCAGQGGDPRLVFLTDNILYSGLPQSFLIDPPNYFATVPENLKPHDYKPENFTKAAVQCDMKLVNASMWNAYEFQTEQLLTAAGLNIYDASVWAIALSINGYYPQAQKYHNYTLLKARTGQLGNIRGNGECKGVMAWGECSDPHEGGVCGLCYGDNNATKTLPKDNALFFRMISDFYAFQHTVLALCPERKQLWVWNDWRPVMGENAWANLLGTLHTAKWAAGNDIPSIPDDGPEMKLAIQFLPAVIAMKNNKSGGIYYAPRNTYDFYNPDIGSSVSTENNASLLAGLKALRYAILQKTDSAYKHLLPEIESLIESVTGYLKSAFSKELGYFRWGGSYDHIKDEFSWGHPGDTHDFATDCQTWVASVLGSDTIDGWFGNGTTLKMWNITKEIAGYGKQPNGMVKGVGYAENSKDQIFSGEWTYGAVNWLRIMARESSYSGEIKGQLSDEADYMAKQVKTELSREVGLKNTTATAILYANKRYFVPFGWYANPLPSLASTSWSLFADNYFNPFHLTGAYITKYDE
jgi:hypothetical protein